MPRRTLHSAAVASSVLAANLVVLTLFLNPELTLGGEARALLLSLFLPYLVLGVVALTLIAFLAGLLRLAARPIVEHWPWLASFLFLAVLGSAAAYGFNLLSYRHSIPVASLRALAAAVVVVVVALVAQLAIGLDTLLYPKRGRSFSAALAVLAPAATLVVPLALRPAPPLRVAPPPVAIDRAPAGRRVTLIGIDGVGPSFIQDGVARGGLPAFARLMRRGASGPLATLRPTEAPPVWTTILTGCLPRDHGVKSFATYRLLGSDRTFELLPKGALVGLLERLSLVATRPATSASRRRRSVWNILNACGIPSGVVRAWGTYPPDQGPAFMLSNYFHLFLDDPSRAAGTLYPPDLLPVARARAVRSSEVDPALVAELVDAPSPTTSVPEAKDAPWRRDLVDRALAPDLTYRRAGQVLRSAYDPPFFASYFYGLDVVGHAFYRYAHPDRFGNVSAADSRRFGRVIDRYAALLSQWVGESAQGLRPGEVLIVVSGYGMEPVPLWRRLVGALAGGASLSGTHEGAPDGFFLAVGDGIRSGAVVGPASVLDVTPTILYLFGLPVARDMEGRVLTEILDEEFARRNPVTFIPSYESLAVAVSGREVDDLPPLPDDEP
jgi:predicted AlkP superfamily phosphohydrolase/phosphomutase